MHFWKFKGLNIYNLKIMRSKVNYEEQGSFFVVFLKQSPFSSIFFSLLFSFFQSCHFSANLKQLGFILANKRMQSTSKKFDDYNEKNKIDTLSP